MTLKSEKNFSYIYHSNIYFQIPIKGSFRRTGRDLFKNLQKAEEDWTDDDQIEYLETKLEELLLKESEVNDKGRV